MQTPEKNSKKISRRTFINPKFVGATLAGTYVGIIEGERALYNFISSSVDKTTTSDNLVSAFLKISEESPNSENSNFKPMQKMLSDEIEIFEKETGTKAYFKRIDEYKGPDFYDKIIKKFNAPSFLFKNPDKLIDEVIRDMPNEASSSFYQSTYVLSSFPEIYQKGSGFLNRFVKKHQELLDSNGVFKDFSVSNNLMVVEGKKEMDEARAFVEDLVSKSNKPIPASVVFGYFLRKNGGDISQSIYDASLFLKFTARNDWNTALHTVDRKNVEWYKNNILDEYQGPNYVNTPNGERDINLIGKVYHSWNLVALLEFVPVEIIRLGGISKQIHTFSDQGLGKTRSDLQTLKDLREVEKLLLSYKRA